MDILRIGRLLPALAIVLAAASLPAGDWPQWGHDNSRNMAAEAKNLPTEFKPGSFKDGTEEIDPATTQNVKWVAKLGSQCYGNVSVAGGRVFIGTNNEVPRLKHHLGDRGVIFCLDEKDGALKWQLSIPKLGAGKVSDWEYLGICSSPQVEGDKVYIMTNRCEVMCLDVNGMANGNDGPFKEEGKYMADAGKPAVETTAEDADILWKYDMRDELGVFPHNITSSSVLIVGDRLYATTSNGQDWSHLNIPSPKAPTLVVLNKNTGEYLGEETSGISTRLFHCNWSSPALAKVGEQEQVVFAAGDGYCYGFDPVPQKGEEDIHPLKELWRVNCNPPEYEKDADGKAYKYPDPKGHSECIATPVVYEGRVYICIGQDPEHGEGVGALTCIDPTKTGDSTKTGGIVWQFKGLHRSISTVAIVNGLVFTADYSGFLHCLDAKTGQVHWTHDAKSHFWASPLVADGKVYIGTDDGDMLVVAADKSFKLINKIEFGGSIRSSVVVANDTLYIATMTHLYAIAAGK